MTSKRKPGPDPAPASLLVPEKLATLVHYLRREKVILDSDLAELYGVPTSNLNKAVQRNIERFPPDFMFQLTEEEWENLRFQFGISSSYGGRRYLPYAFTEQGVAMLSSVLRSERAVEVNIAIMRTGLPQGRAMHDRPRRMKGRRDEQNANHRHSMRIGGHVPPLLDPQPTHLREGLTIDELRLLIFDLTKRPFLPLLNQKSKINNRHSAISPSNHCSLLTAHCSLLTAHCSLLTAHCSLLTAHCSLLTAHCRW